MIPEQATVYVIDDDAAVRRALRRLLGCAGYHVEVLPTSEHYLNQSATPHACACLVVDVRMPGMSGLDLQRAIIGTRRELPIVLVTGHGDEFLRREAMALGVVEVLF